VARAHYLFIAGSPLLEHLDRLVKSTNLQECQKSQFHHLSFHSPVQQTRFENPK
jgi:hypothetical protein